MTPSTTHRRKVHAMRSSNPTVDKTADDAADLADNAIRSSQRFANQALDQIADRVDTVRERANAAISSTQALTKRGIDAVRDGSQQLRQQALRATDSTAAYVKEEPFKSILIAAAVGAGLMALIGLMVSRSSSRE